MASADSPDTLETLLNQATDPSNPSDRWDCIQGFYQRVTQDADGPQVAVRLLAHKIQSPQEREALQALTVLEACMNNCGKKFHNEAAKFKFLNELIKVLSPKYFGLLTPGPVKDRVTEVLYGWTLWLKDQPKIQEAYSMLKKQGIVKKDPNLSAKLIMPPAPQRSTPSIFDQEDKAQLLDRLLKSGRSEDLETANRLIKNAMQAEQEKAERVQKRDSTVKEAHSSTRELRVLLEQSGMSQPSPELKCVYERCDRLRPGLFRLASETTDDDDALSHILAANDELTLALSEYKTHLSRQSSGGEGEDTGNRPVSSPREVKSYHLIDFSSLDSEQTSCRPHSPVEHSEENTPHNDYPTDKRSYLEELMQLDEEVDFSPDQHCPSRSNGTHPWSLSHSRPFSKRKTDEAPSLQNICVPMDAIKSSHLEPISLLDRGGVHVSLHFSRDPPVGHPSVAVMVLSTINTSAFTVRDFTFQAAVPKSMCVKLQPASGTQLLPYSPLAPPAALSQVVLLANPQQTKVRLRYKLTLTHGDQCVNESGEISCFPEWSTLIGQ